MFLQQSAFKAALLVLTLAAAWPAAAAFAPPAPPPELNTTLTEFKTQEQRAHEDFIRSGVGGSLIDVPGPAAAGDRAAGVVRLSFDYVPELTLFVPQLGHTFVRLVDGAGQMLELQSFKLDRPAFLPELTAAPGELELTKQAGASSAMLALQLAEAQRPLIFTLQAKAAANGERAVQHFVYTIVLRKLHALQSFTLTPYAFIQLNAADKLPPADSSFAKLAQVMHEGLREIRRTGADNKLSKTE